MCNPIMRKFIMFVTLLLSLTNPCLYGAILQVDLNNPESFGSIQEAINNARNFDTVIVHPGIYYENIDFNAKAITVRSIDPNDTDVVASTIIDANGVGNVVSFRNSETPYSKLLGISLANGSRGIQCADDSCKPQIERCLIYSNVYGIREGAPIIIDCIIRDNTSCGVIFCSGEIRKCTITGNGASGIVCSNDNTIIANSIVTANVDYGVSFNASSVTIKNCTILGNGNSGIFCGHNSTGSSDAIITNCIIAWNMRYGISAQTSSGLSLTLGYNNLYLNESGNYNTHIVPGETDIHEYPWFAINGFWDEDDNWHEGDYHLLSTVGRWDPVVKEWINDPIDSPCIDRGDPNMPVGDEPEPNGGIINMGAYGGTDEASMSVNDHIEN